MKFVSTISRRLINGSLLPSKFAKAKSQRCLCTTIGDPGQPENPSGQNTKDLRELLDDAAQGLGPLDRESDEDDWCTSPYPESAVINPKQSQSAKSLRPTTDPSNTSVILFPGYGSQFVGMGRELIKFPAARDIFDASSAILKMDVLKLMMNGPKGKLDSIKYADPLIYICSLAALEKLKEERPWAIENCVATAGFSVGEITALTFAGVFTFIDGLKLVRARAEAIEVASEMEPGGMAVVHYTADSKLKEAIAAAKEWCSDRGINEPECIIATYLSPNMKVIAGHTEALSFIQAHLTKFRLRRMFRIKNISGAIHTKLMEPASKVMKELLSTVELSEPSTHIYSNVTAKPYGSLVNVRRYLPRQICKPMLWEQLIHRLFDRDSAINIPSVFTCGPGSPQLKVNISRVHMGASRNCIFVF